MSDTQVLMKKAEGFVRWRRGVLVLNALAYVGWIGGAGLSHLGVVAIDNGLLGLISTVSLVVWIVSLMTIFAQMNYARRHREISRLADDERTVTYTKTAFQTGYWLLLIALGCAYAASYFTDLDIKAVVPFLLALGVAAPSLTYAVLDRG